jgi:cleavage stimulation factor subunit 3
VDGKDNFQKIHELYTKLLSALAADLDALEAAGADTSGVGNASGSTLADTSGANLANTWGASQATLVQANSSQSTSQNSQQSNSAAQAHSKELHEHRKEFGVVYIMYVRFARRAEGQESASKILDEARKQSWTPWQVYEAAGAYTVLFKRRWLWRNETNKDRAATSEYHATRDAKEAARIYSKGYALLKSDVDFVVNYLNFLIQINDMTSACRHPSLQSAATLFNYFRHGIADDRRRACGL